MTFIIVEHGGTRMTCMQTRAHYKTFHGNHFKGSQGLIEHRPLVPFAANEKLLLNPNCCCKILLDYIKTRCKVNPKGVIDLIDENGQVSELFLKTPLENLNSIFSPRGVYILASIEMYEDNTVKKITPLLQDWEKKYIHLESQLKQCDRKLFDRRNTKMELKPAPQPHPKEAKEKKILRKMSNKTQNGPGRKENSSPAPDVHSSPKKTKKKLKIIG